MAVVALVVVGVVLLFATGIIRVPQAQPGTASSSEASSVVAEEVSSEAPVSSTVSLVNDPNVPYQSLYPELAVESVEFTPRTEGDKVVYLTFNDAPSENTDELLQALAAANVKATFFVTAANM
ncbi:MAG: polysaccharide deacetylase family protein, partial [Oscillospiraceae bacterium]|nr:polysaccharide deacetylase family protein [Oscillospiraceae bacterium]